MSADSSLKKAADELIRWSTAPTTWPSTTTKQTSSFFELQKHNIPSITVADGDIQRIAPFKLSHVTISASLSWDEHVNAICKKASKRLHFMQLLKRASASNADMITCYKFIVGSVIEYASPVGPSSLTVGQRLRLEWVQRRAAFIIAVSNDYELQCVILNIELIGNVHNWLELLLIAA
jgi:hypothetical protein